MINRIEKRRTQKERKETGSQSCQETLFCGFLLFPGRDIDDRSCGGPPGWAPVVVSAGCRP
jgi:hypothetical protein